MLIKLVLPAAVIEQQIVQVHAEIWFDIGRLNLVQVNKSFLP